MTCPTPANAADDADLERAAPNIMDTTPENQAPGGAAMSTTYNTTGLAQTITSPRRVSSAFNNFWGAFQEWRKWERLRADFCNLSDRELMDIGITRGEIDYVVSNQGIDPRGIRSAEGNF